MTSPQTHICRLLQRWQHKNCLGEKKKELSWELWDTQLWEPSPRDSRLTYLGGDSGITIFKSDSDESMSKFVNHIPGELWWRDSVFHRELLKPGHTYFWPSKVQPSIENLVGIWCLINRPWFRKWPVSVMVDRDTRLRNLNLTLKEITWDSSSIC